MKYEQKKRFTFPGLKEDIRYSEGIVNALSKDVRKFSTLIRCDITYLVRQFSILL